MKTKTKITAVFAALFIIAFVIWTVAVCNFDVRAIGPEGTSVGFAALNGFVHDNVGVNMTLYTVTDILGLVPFAFVLGFAVLGLVQLIVRKSIKKTDKSILVLGVFYIAVAAVYIFFEKFAVNYRPVLINGVSEISYPSSTTMLCLCVMPTAAMQLRGRIHNKAARAVTVAGIYLFAVFMVAARLVSGVHWVTDIIGGVFISFGLVMLYATACDIFAKEQN